MSFNKQLIGKKFGRLEVIAQEKYGYVTCRCACGKEKRLRSYNLTSGKTKSCGCLFHERAKTAHILRERDSTTEQVKLPPAEGKHGLIPLVGLKFGLLEVQSYNGNGWWLCECECGNKLNVRGSTLKNGNTKSCGCLRRKNAGRPPASKLGRLFSDSTFRLENQQQIIDIYTWLKDKAGIDIVKVGDHWSLVKDLEYHGKYRSGLSAMCHAVDLITGKR